MAKTAPTPTWRTIASAPRDGTNILGAYRADGASWVVEVIWREREFGLAVWRGFGFDGCEESRTVNPTHWMPLPAPPTGEQTNE